MTPLIGAPRIGKIIYKIFRMEPSKDFFEKFTTQFRLIESLQKLLRRFLQGILNKHLQLNQSGIPRKIRSSEFAIILSGITSEIAPKIFWKFLPELL